MVLTAVLGRLIPLLGLALVLLIGQMRYQKDGNYHVAIKPEIVRRIDSSKLVHATTNATQGPTEPTEIPHDIHYSQKGILELQPWEIGTLEKPYSSSCKTPTGVNDFCCLGAPSHELHQAKKAFDERRTTCDHLTLQDYQLQQEQAREELSAMDGSQDDECDVCGLVNRLYQNNRTFAFFGDSVSSQTANAFACELQRRNYTVALQSVPLEKHEGSGDQKFREIRRLSIQSPTWNVDSTTALTMDFLFQYRLPMVVPEERELIASNYDVLVVNFGHHWHYMGRTAIHQNRMPPAVKDLFDTIQKANKVQLLVWRENSASHFDVDGGDYSLARAKPGFDKGSIGCVPHYDRTADRSVVAWRERRFHEAIQQTNYTVVTAGRHMPPMVTNNGRPEVVVVPFYDFSSKNHAFHKKMNGTTPDCLHFCYSPFLYLPIWRGVRLAMDRSFPRGVL